MHCVMLSLYIVTVLVAINYLPISKISYTFVTGPGKTSHVGTFSVMRKTDLKY